MKKKTAKYFEKIMDYLGLDLEDDSLCDTPKRVAQMYDRGKAINFATAFEIDEVIDPMDTRHWILSGLKASPAPQQREGKKRPFIDTW